MSNEGKKVHHIASLRDQILRAEDATSEKVHVSEWGVDVWVRGLTGAERDAIEDSMVKGKGKVDEKRADRLRHISVPLTACGWRGPSP